MRFLVAVGFVVAIFVAPGTPAHAGDNDIVMSRLGDITTDGMGNPNDVIGSNQLFRSMASELGVVFAPRILAPADTLRNLMASQRCRQTLRCGSAPLCLDRRGRRRSGDDGEAPIAQAHDDGGHFADGTQGAVF